MFANGHSSFAICNAICQNIFFPTHTVRASFLEQGFWLFATVSFSLFLLLFMMSGLDFEFTFCGCAK